MTKIIFTAVVLLLCLLRPTAVDADNGGLFNDAALLDTSQVIDLQHAATGPVGGGWTR